MKWLLLLPLLWVAACSQQAPACFDAEMKRNHPGICTKDCPGVTACNGQHYCNECEANRAGYVVR